VQKNSDVCVVFNFGYFFVTQVPVKSYAPTSTSVTVYRGFMAATCRDSKWIASNAPDESTGV